MLFVSAAFEPGFQTVGSARFFPAGAEIPGWVESGPPEIYEREGLYGYINGGSEIILQYGFKRVEVGRFKKMSGRTTAEVTIDLYRMGTPLDAFGIFSMRRQGGERTLDLGGVPNWISDSQAALAAGAYFVNIIGFETKKEDLELFAGRLAGKLMGAGEKPFDLSGTSGPWSALPKEGLLRDSLRIVMGKLAAQEESEILAPDFWGFATGTMAASARYAPDGRKLIVADFGTAPARLAAGVKGVFEEFLTDVRYEGAVLSAKNGPGYIFLFSVKERRAALVFGRRDESAARALLAAALESGSR